VKTIGSGERFPAGDLRFYVNVVHNQPDMTITMLHFFYRNQVLVNLPMTLSNMEPMKIIMATHTSR